jgi:integrase
LGAFRRYEESCRLHIKPTLGKVRLSRLNPLQLQDLYTQKIDSGLSARTVQIIHATLHKALKQAVRWCLIPRNVAEAVTPPRPVKGEIQPLTRAQIKALLDAARGEKLYALYALACTTGMRQGELLGLQWRDLDLEAGTLTINRSVSKDKVNPPKTSSGRRTIRLSKLAISALQQHRVRTRKPRISEWVFGTNAGTPISRHNLHNRSWKPLLERAGLPYTTRFHDLRHSCISLLLAKGVPLKVVSEMAGHADVSITLSVYGHVLPDMQSLSADAMDDALEEGDDDQEQTSS